MSITLYHFIFKKYWTSVLILIIFSSVLLTGLKEVENKDKVTKKHLIKLQSKETVKNGLKYSKTVQRSIQTVSTNMSQIPYRSEQKSNLSFLSRNFFSINTTETCQTLLKSEPISSFFLIDSNVSSEKTIWVNNIEPDYGEVNITKVITPEIPFYRLKFVENNVTPASGASNINFNVTSNPPPFNHSTDVSFEFQIPEIDNNLLNGIHSLVLELRFNNASINFVLSDVGSSFGDPLEENVYKPGSNSLYIVYNDSYPTDWVIISQNITRLITTYFPQSEYSWFTQIDTLFCYLFAFIPEYNVILDIRSFNFSTSLPINCPVTYFIGGSTVFSENGTIQYEYITNNISILTIENTSWVDNQITFFKLIIIRNKELFTQPALIDWNTTFLQIQFMLILPELLSIPHSKFILMKIPHDWYSIESINSSATIEKLDKIELLSGNLIGYEYLFSIQESEDLIIQCQVLNYFSNISAPMSAVQYDKIEVSGNILNPFPGIIHLYLLNDSVFIHQTTLSILNGSFIFPLVSISDVVSLGFIDLILNWSCGYEFGIYQNLLYIHQTEGENSLINFTTPQNYELYQYDPFFVNLTLIKNDQIYESDSALVFLVIDTYTYTLNRSFSGNYYFTVNHILWPPKVYNISLIASDNQDFFAEENLNLTVYPAVLDWHINNIPSIVYAGSNFSLEIEVFVSPLEGGTQWPVVGINLEVMINDLIVIGAITDLFGHASIIIPSEIFTHYDIFQLLLICTIKDSLVKIHTSLIQVTSKSTQGDRFHPTLNEYTQTSIFSNNSFYRIYNVNYSTNASQWYIPIEKINGFPISAHLLRNDYALEVDILGDSLIWDLQSNSSDTDTLVLEYLGPIVFFTVTQEDTNYMIHIESFANYTITNYTVELDLSFIKFPIGEISLLDFLKRNITDKFEITTVDSTVFLKKLYIIEGIKVNYYIEVKYELPSIVILDGFKSEYAYDELIQGSWKFNSPSNFSYSIEFTIIDYYHSVSENTSLINFSNGTFLVKARLPVIRWNSTVIVRLNLFFSNEVSISSPIQILKIIDPYPPDCTYFIESNSKTYDLHLFIYEPDIGSGMNTIHVLSSGDEYNASSFSPNHYIIRIPKTGLQIENITVIITDCAGNIKILMLDSQNFIPPDPSGEILNPSILPLILSILFVGGISFVKYMKKKKSIIL